VDTRPLARPEMRDGETALAADATQLAVGAHERRLSRDVVAEEEVPSGQAATVVDSEPVACEAAGAYRRRVSLLVDRYVASG